MRDYYQARGAMLLKNGESIAYLGRQNMTLPQVKRLAAEIADVLNAAAGAEDTADEEMAKRMAGDLRVNGP